MKAPVLTTRPAGNALEAFFNLLSSTASRLERGYLLRRQIGEDTCAPRTGSGVPMPRPAQGRERERVDAVEALTFDTVVGTVCRCPSWAALSPADIPPAGSPKQGQHRVLRAGLFTEPF